MWKFIKRNKWLVSGSLVFVTLISVLGVSIGTQPPLHTRPLTIGQGSVVLRIGTEVDASSTVDYVCDGTNDNVQFQGALDALPANGGEIDILSGNYSFGATVTRAIPNVTIKGVGKATYLAYNAGTAIFTAGGNNWSYSNFRVDTTTAQLVTSMGATTLWSWENISTSDGYFAYRTASSTTASSWNIPTGRTASYVIAASDSTSTQYDQKLAGTNDQVAINAELVILNALGTKQKLSLVGDFTTNGTINALSNVDVDLNGTITCTSNSSSTPAILFNGLTTPVTNCMWTNINAHRAGTTTDNTHCIFFEGNVSPLVIVRNSNFYMDAISSVNNTIGCDAIAIINDASLTWTTSPILEYCNGTVTAGCSNGNNMGINLWTIGVNSAPTLNFCNGTIASTVQGAGTTNVGIDINESMSTQTTLNNCIGLGLNGIWIAMASPTLNNCVGIGDDYESHAGSGIGLEAGNPILNNCQGYANRYDYSNALYLGEGFNTNAYPLINGGIFSPKISEGQVSWALSGTGLPDSGKFYPDTVYPFTTCDGWTIVTSGSNPGITLNLGAWGGGNTLASSIDVSGSAGACISFIPNYLNFSANNPIYATLSGNFTGTLQIFYHTMCNKVARGIMVNTTSPNFAGVINGATIYGNAQQAVRIDTVTLPTIFRNCTIKSFGGTALYYPSAATNIPFYNCQITGTITNVTSYAKGTLVNNSGTWAVLNGQTSVVITHGLGWTPQAGDIAIGFTTLDASTACYIDTYTSTQFTVHVNAAATAATTTGWWKAIR